MTDSFTADEKRALLRRLAGDGPADCPRCGVAVERRSVPPRSEVAYVRDRIWIVCGGCERTAVFDRREVERAGEE